MAINQHQGQININEQQFGLWNKTAQDKPKVNVLDKMQTAANEKLQELMKHKVVMDVNEKLDIIKMELREEYHNMDQRAQLAIRQQKQKMNIWIKQKIEQVILQTLEKLKPTFQDSLKDPYMCVFVKDMVDDVFEELWPDIRDQILFQVRIKYADPYENVEFKKPQLCCIQYPWYWLRKWYLYTYIPFDRGIWQRIRTVSWWIVFIVKLIPFYGIQSFIYLIVFLCIDKKDEYQLVSFILNFKSMQFLTLGVIGTMIGYFTFYSCSVVSKLDDSYIDCQSEGPAIFLNFWSDIVGFLLQTILVWIAFILLPFSQTKGKVIFKHQKSLREPVAPGKCCCCTVFVDRGGRLKSFMTYDIICFIGCIALFLGLSLSNGLDLIWQYRSTMYLAKTVYGILSFPFLIFMVPGFTWVLSRSHGTGYDKYGNCVPIVQDLYLYNKRKMNKKEEYDPMYIRSDQTMEVVEDGQLMDEIL